MSADARQRLQTFFSGFETKKFRKGDILIHPDEVPTSIYFLQSGYVRDYSLSSEGVELTIHIFAPFSYFPLMAAISGIKNRHFYEVMTDAQVTIAPRNEVTEFLKSDPEVLFDLTRRLLIGLDKLTMRIEYLALETAKTRVATALQFLSHHFGTKSGATVRFQYPFTHRDIAAFAGVSRETASRQWEKLLKDGIVAMEKEYIVIADPEGLETLGNI